MRIQGINQTGVPGAEQISLGAISSAAQGKMRTTQALTKVVSDYQVMSEKAEAVAQYGQNYQSSLMALDASYDEMINQPHFDDKNNPTYRDISKRWNTLSLKHVSETLNNFTNKTASAKYQTDISTYLRGKSNDIRGVARTRQVDYANGVLASQILSYSKQPNGAAMIQAAIEQQVQIGFMTPEAGVNELQSSLEDHAATQVTMSIESATSDTDLDAIRLSLINNTNPYLSLSTVQSAFTSIQQRENQIDKDFDDKQTATYVDALTKIVMGDITNEGEIDLLLTGEQITPAYHATLSKRLNEEIKGPEVDDWNEYTLVKLNIWDYTAADILNNTMLTRPTRIKLIADLEKWNDDQNTDLDWVGTQSGKEATRRLKAEFPVASGKFNLFGAASAEADAALTKLYDAVQNIPLGKRESSVIDLANKIIQDSRITKPEQGPPVPETIQEIIDLYPPGPERKKVLDAWGKKKMQNVPSNDYIRTTQNSIMSLAKELGVIV
jgi:hypothetical protein